MRAFAVVAFLGLAASAAAFPATLPAKNWTSVLPTSLSTYNKTNPANAWPAPRFLGSAVTNATLTKLKAKVNVTGYPILIGKKANNTNATWTKVQVDTWLNKTYLPKANNTSPLAGAGSIANQKLTNAARTTSYVYNATAAKLVNAVAAKSNLTRTATVLSKP